MTDDVQYWIERARWASVFGYPTKEAYARRKIKQLRKTNEARPLPDNQS